MDPNEDDDPLDPFAVPGDPTTTPLSIFYPGITPDEEKLLDGETVLICGRRSRCVSLYRAQWSMAEIAKELKCSLGTVHRDLHAVMEGYRRIAMREMGEHLADALQMCVHRERQVEEDLERSRQTQVEVSSSQRSKGKGKDKDSDWQEAVKKRQKYGDPKLHALLHTWHVHRCKLLGLLKIEDEAGALRQALAAMTDKLEAANRVQPQNPRTPETSQAGDATGGRGPAVEGETAGPPRELPP